MRALTAGLLILAEVRRDAITAEAASRAARTLSRPSFKARASTPSSATFCTAKDSQLRTSGSRSVSRPRSIGVCSSEQDGATTDLPSRGDDGLDTVEDSIQIGRPDVAAVNDAQRQDEIRARAGDDSIKLLRRAHQVDMQAVPRGAPAPSADCLRDFQNRWSA